MALAVGGAVNLTPGQNQARQKKLDDKQPQHPGLSEALVDDGGRDLEELTPASLLQRFSDSVDEMSVLLTQFRNRRDFEKKISSSSDSSFEQVLDEDVHPKVCAILKITAGAEGANLNFLMRQIRSLFPDDSDIVLVLRELLRRRSLDEITKKRLKTLLQKVEAQANPRRLKAGINVALKARLFEKSLDLSPALIRESYREFLESDANETIVYQDWIATYGVEKRTLVVDFMESSLLTDMDAQDPSCSKIEFGHLLQRLIQLKLIRSSDANFLKVIFNNTIISAFNSSEREWLVFMFCVLEHPGEIKKLLEELLQELMRLSGYRDRGCILQTIYQACINLPGKLFSEPAYMDVLVKELEQLITIVYRNESAESMTECGVRPTKV
ncbi:type III secretion system gatekeeper subunit SctW [Serratia marcescens]|uniref:type III secretion system gatekeeper subunit SctW n=1 Tax=Serratia marcescens TaxID=615 RepID=UPI00148E4518|nr:type III secretion system gatekeeper subunit SctW [Serratia marcescens]QJU42326.1 type III secretion system gatekeeper subunit SctW [Serratia marcescens]